MSTKEYLSKNSTSIAIVVVILLCAAGFAYSQGWFNWFNSNLELESNRVSGKATIQQDMTNDDGEHMTQGAAEAVDAARE